VCHLIIRNQITAKESEKLKQTLYDEFKHLLFEIVIKILVVIFYDSQKDA
jgi:hypothetical protein